MSFFAFTSANIGKEEEFSLLPFTVNKLVAAGASITNFSFEQGSIVKLIEDYASSKYQMTVDVDDHATGGWTAQDLDDEMPSILSNYSGETGVVFAIHIGGNNINYSETWDQRTQPEKDALINPYQDIINAIEAAGHRAIPYLLTYRVTNGGPDDDPALDPKVNELSGSFTYNKNGLIPNLFAVNFPQYFNAGTYNFDHYKYVRSMNDIMFSSGDTVHFNDMGEVIFAFYHTYPVFEASEGRYMPEIEEVNFSNEFQDPVTNIDVIFAPFTNAGGRGLDPNINWVDMGSVNITEPGYIGSGIVQTDGSAAPSGMTFLYSGPNKSFSTDAETPADTSASLLNTSLRSSWAFSQASVGKAFAIIEGLEPNRKYTVEVVPRHDTGEDQRYRANTEAEYDPTAFPNKIAIIETRADPYGRIFILCTEVTSGNGNAGLAGVRVRSGWDSPSVTYVPIVLSFGGASGSGENINFITQNLLSDPIDTNGDTVTGVRIANNMSGGNSSGGDVVTNPADSSNSITNKTLLESTRFFAGTGTLTISGLAANSTWTLKIAANRNSAARTQDVSINGGANYRLDVSQNPTEIYEVTGVNADGSGEIDISLIPVSSSFSYISGLEMVRTA